MIVVTGGAGLIGSAIVWELNNRGIDDIIVVDHLGDSEKWKNLVNRKFADYYEKGEFLEKLLKGDFKKIDTIFHMGACSNTQEYDATYLIENNFEYTKKLAEYSVKNNIRFIYASSAATYGDGSLGYSDSSIDNLKPLNMYGYSKHLFDLWAQKKGYLDKIVGLKYFNVYGPNEYHKGDMRSLVNKAYCQIKETGKLKLFKSYKSEYKYGEQMRDFLYVKDAVKMTVSFMSKKNVSGIFNIGSGRANTWNKLAECIFKAMDMKPKIEYVDMPDYLKEKYQYHTKADTSKIQEAECTGDLFTLENAVADYVKNYLSKDVCL
ncbi:ADP-glyceromanno-heptose 6-epimerase [bacterium]